MDFKFNSMVNDGWKPLKDEYNTFYQGYISIIEDKNVPDLFEKQIEEYLGFFGSLDESQASLPYAPGKWTYKEALGHVLDTDKIMHFRALCFTRQEGVKLPGFDQDSYVEKAGFQKYPISDLLDSFLAHRVSLAKFLKGLSQTDLTQRGKVDGQVLSVRAICNIIVGHAAHHMNILRGIN